MFIRTDAELERLGRIRFPMANDMFRSARFLTAADRMGYSYNENRARQGIDAIIWLKHHWEANYIISGKGEVTDLTDGRTWSLAAGVLYVVGPNDWHRLQVSEDMHYVSIFCPPLKGDEHFDADGGYEASGPIDKTDRRMFVKQADEMRRAGQEIVVADGQARTVRMLTKADGVGFGFSDVRLAQGAEAVLWYKHHWEANHIISGTGEVSDLTTGEAWTLEPGMAYNVGPRDRHHLRAHTDMHLVSMFCPPLIGDEQHDEDGALAPSGPVPPGPPGY
ncbi:ectoine synthase [Taklimakanibacter lacteus]|uniref:ectoine synthase n=1 Tax=Taklimakanibacter lacteus TaxID=2268456 RepID=UPI0013C4229A